MNVIEAIAQLYSDIFSEIVDRLKDDVEGHGQMVPCSFAQVGMNGNQYLGSNQQITTAVSMGRGFALPIWLTDITAKAMGLHIDDYHYVPIVKYREGYRKQAESGEYVTITEDEYKQLPKDQQRKYRFWQSRMFHKGFNIEQTNLAALYPEVYEELKEFYAIGDADKQCEALDEAVESGKLMGVNIFVGDYKAAGFNENMNAIKVPDRSHYSCNRDYYSDILHQLIFATGAHSMFNRNRVTGSMMEYAREELTAELGKITLAGALGITTELRCRDASILKQWATIAGTPNNIKEVVYDASKAADAVIKSMGIEQSKGYDLDARLSSIEAVKEHRERYAEKREQLSLKFKDGKAQMKAKSQKSHKTNKKQ